MKAFLASLLVAVILAASAGLVLERFLSREADVALAAPSARVGAESSVEHRGWASSSGRES